MNPLTVFLAASQKRRLPFAATAVLGLLVLSQSGCLGITANLMHMVGADMVPAQYEDLSDCRLAIVTMSQSSIYKPDDAAITLSKRVGAILTQKVDDVRLVRQNEIQQYRDRVGLEDNDYVALGNAVEAEKVLLLELDNLKLREGKSMFKGSADVTVSVIDVATGDELFRREVEEYTFPRTAGQHVTETNENRFQKLYLTMLSQEIARTFHPYDFSDTFAQDGAIARE